MRSKKELELVLSKLEGFSNPTLQLEQYATPADIASDWIWSMAMKSEVAGRTFLDAASGPGILGIGLLLLGARKVYFVDLDHKIMQVCIKNYESIKEEYEIGQAEFIVEDITIFDQEVDIVVQNPPFGTKEKHADKKFLEKAFEIAPIVYSMHKWSTEVFIHAVAKDYSFQVTDTWRHEFSIKSAFFFHKKPVRKIDVGLWRMEKVL